MYFLFNLRSYLGLRTGQEPICELKEGCTILWPSWDVSKFKNRREASESGGSDDGLPLGVPDPSYFESKE